MILRNLFDFYPTANRKIDLRQIFEIIILHWEVNI